MSTPMTQRYIMVSSNCLFCFHCFEWETPSWQILHTMHQSSNLLDSWFWVLSLTRQILTRPINPKQLVFDESGMRLMLCLNYIVTLAGPGGRNRDVRVKHLVTQLANAANARPSHLTTVDVVNKVSPKDSSSKTAKAESFEGCRPWIESQHQ